MNPFIRLLGMKNSTDKNSNYHFINVSLTFAPRIPAKNEMKKTSQSDGHLFVSIFDERFLRSPAAAVICEIEEGEDEGRNHFRDYPFKLEGEAGRSERAPMGMGKGR